MGLLFIAVDKHSAIVDFYLRETRDEPLQDNFKAQDIYEKRDRSKVLIMSNSNIKYKYNN